VGKTTLCSFLSKKYGYRHVEIGSLVAAGKLYSGYDEERRAPIADVKRLRQEVRSLIARPESKVVLLDGHYAHDLVGDTTTFGVFVMRFHPVRLYRRSLRLYDIRKAKENCLSEFLGTIAFEARKSHSRVADVDCTGLPVSKVASKLTRLLSKRRFPRTPPIDWTKRLDDGSVRRFLRVVEAQVLLG
jgi:broad-specificity NMP kinase